MTNEARQKLRDFIAGLLEKRGQRRDFSDSDPLFTSGRLDSFSMTTLIVYLEETFGIDFAKVDFDVDLVDTIDDIAILTSQA